MVNYRLFAFYNIDNLVYETKLPEIKYRYSELSNLISKIDISQASRTDINKLNISVKDFYLNGNRAFSTNVR